MRQIKKLAVFAGAVGAMAGIGVLAVSGKLPLIKKPGTPAVDSAQTTAPTDQTFAAAVTVASAAREKFTETLQVTGTLVAREEILVGPEVEGLRIIEVLADEGDRVKKGQILARLVSDTLDAQVSQNDATQAKAVASIAQARSNVVSAEARAVEAKNAFERGKPLRQSGYLSEALLDQREAAYKTAQAAVAAARDGMKAAEADKAQVEAQRKELNWRRGRTDVPAPADGIISRRVARVGGFAAGAGDAMFRIILQGEIELEAEIPELRLARLKKDQPVTIALDGAATLAGKVRLVSPEVDKATRLGRIRILVEPNPALRIGAFARGSIDVEQSTGLGVPSSAIQHLASGPVVQVVKDGRVALRAVKLGLVAAGRTEIRSGIEERDLVVVRAGTFLRDGDAVRPIIAGQQAQR
jgi:HlyD family secretion protein